MATIRTMAAAAARIEEIGIVDRDLDAIQSALNAKVAEARAAAEAAAAPLIDQRDKAAAELRAYCDANRVNLTEGGKSKTCKFVSGEAGWRMGQKKVLVDPAQEASIIERFKRSALDRLIRIKESLNLRAIADEPSAIKGVWKGITIQPAEESFWVKPAEMALADSGR